MGRPTSAPMGKVSTLRMRLTLEEGAARAFTIASVAAVYADLGDLGRTAAHFGLSRRTLERLLDDHADLAAAISQTRASIGRPCE